MPSQVKLKHKRSIGEKLKDTCTTIIQSLRQISNAVLVSSDHDKEVDDLFHSSDSDNYYPNSNISKFSKSFKHASAPTQGDLESAIRHEKSLLHTETERRQQQQRNLPKQHNSPLSPTLITRLQPDTTVETTPIGSFNSMPNNQSSNTTLNTNGFQLWELQREEWLKPTQTTQQISSRISSSSLQNMVSHNDDIYLAVYRNLVQQNKPLKKGINMVDAFKVIHDGWENTKLYERVSNGGVP